MLAQLFWQKNAKCVIVKEEGGEGMRPLGERITVNFAFHKFKASRYSAYANRSVYENDRKDDHIHDFAQVWYCCYGKYTHRVGDQTFECTEGSVVIVPSGTFHEISVAAGEAETMELSLSYKLFLESSPEGLVNTIANLCLSAFSQELGYSIPLYVMLSPRSCEQAEEYLSWLSMLRYIPKETVRKEEIYEKLEALFSLPEFALPEKYREKILHIAQTRLFPVLQILSYLNIHYPEKIQEEKLLQACGISRRGMYRYFKPVAGLSYSQYLQQLRVAHALTHLRQSRYALSHIADLCGFCDVSYMSRVFQRCIGESPKRTHEIMNKCKE